MEQEPDYPAYRTVRFRADQGMPFSRELVLDFAREITGYTVRALVGRRRTKEAALSRQFAMWLTLAMRDDGLSETGRFFGKHHSTVIHARTKINHMIADGRLPEEWQRVARHVLAHDLRNLTEPSQ